MLTSLASVLALALLALQAAPCGLTKGTADLASLNAAVRARGQPLAACFQLAKPPPAPAHALLGRGIGNLNALSRRFELTVSARGALEAISATPADARVEACLRENLAALVLPRAATVTCDVFSITVSRTFKCPNGARPVGSECQLGDGQDGAYGRWTAEGAPLDLGRFRRGQRHGTWTLWHPPRDGSKPVRAKVDTWADGQLDGEWQSWNEEGTQTGAGTYARGLAVGTWREWHANGALRTVTQHLRPGVLGLVTHYDQVGDAIGVDAYDGGLLEQKTRLAYGEPISAAGGTPPMCNKLEVKPLPSPGFVEPARVWFTGFAGDALVMIALNTARLEARVFRPGAAAWVAVPIPPASGRLEAIRVLPLEEGKLFVTSEYPVTAQVLDVPNLQWQSLPAPELDARAALAPGFEARAVLSGRRCVYAWRRPRQELHLQHGFRWCVGEAGWSALVAPERIDVTEHFAVTRGDDLFVMAPSSPHPGQPFTTHPEPWRAAAYDARSGAWSPVEVPMSFGVPRVFETGRGVVVLDTVWRDGPERGGTYGGADAGWQPLAIPGAQRLALDPWPGSAAVVVHADHVGSRFLYDPVRRRFSVVPEDAELWPHYLWLDGRLTAMGDSRSVGEPRFSVLDWVSRSWCTASLYDASLVAPPHLDHKGRRLRTTSTYGLVVGENAAAIWGRDDTTVLPCNAVVCPHPELVRRHTDVGVIAVWPRP